VKIKIVGFKVGLSRPTCIKTVELKPGEIYVVGSKHIGSATVKLGEEVAKALDKSDFISIRKVE